MNFPRTENIKKSLIRKMYEMADEDCIDLSIGIPYSETPTAAKKAAIRAINENKTFYTANRGTDELRELIAENFAQKHEKRIHKKNITVHVGSTEAFFSVLFSVLIPGDSVLLPDPGYPAYESVTKMLGANIIKYASPINGDESEYKSIKKSFNENVKVVVINSPANPTGRVIPGDYIKKIADFLRDKDILVLSDEIYSDLVYTGNFTSIGDFLPLEKVVIISGVSKSYGMTGWRIGWSISSEKNAVEFNKPHMYTVSCAPSVSQYAAIGALKDMHYAKQIYSDMKVNREMALSQLREIKYVNITPPHGAIFLFVDVSKSGDGEKIAMKLLKKEKVITVPGIGFGRRGKNYIRISFGVTPDTLREGLSRLKHFFDNL